MALPAYDQCIKASHVFNLLDARGVISVTERQSYIMRVRELAKACGEAWVHTEAGGAASYPPLEGEGRSPTLGRAGWGESGSDMARRPISDFKRKTANRLARKHNGRRANSLATFAKIGCEGKSLQEAGGYRTVHRRFRLFGRAAHRRGRWIAAWR